MSHSHPSLLEENPSRLAAYPAPTMNSDHNMGYYPRMAPEMAHHPAAGEGAALAAPANSMQNHVHDPPLRHGASDSATPERQQPVEVKTEPGIAVDTPPPSDATMQAIMAFLRKNNLMDTETKLKEELKKREASSSSSSSGASNNGSSRPIAAAPAAADQEVGNVLASYKSEGDPSSYESAYK